MTLSAAQFRAEFASEGQMVEFKRGVGTSQLQDTIVAFSNAEGGVILIGVNDDGTIEGRALDAGTADAVHQVMRNVRDPGRYELHPVTVDERPLTVIAVARRQEGFAQTSAGIPRSRRGTRDEVLFGADLQRLINERSHVRYESTRASVTLDAVNDDLVRELARAFSWGAEHVRPTAGAGVRRWITPDRHRRAVPTRRPHNGAGEGLR